MKSSYSTKKVFLHLSIINRRDTTIPSFYTISLHVLLIIEIKYYGKTKNGK